jgi:hypothetical protein
MIFLILNTINMPVDPAGVPDPPKPKPKKPGGGK